LAWAHRTLDEIAKPAGGTNSKATEAYQELRAAFPDLPLAQDAAFELAELLADRGEADAAVKLLNDVLEKEPAPELADKVRLRIGACLATKGDGKEALAYFEALTQNSKPPLAGQARYRAGELLLRHKEYAKAAAHLQAFRDQPSLQNVPGLTDRALLRLGHAYAYLGQWDRSRQAHEMLTSRFGQSVWVHEARYGIGWAWQNQKNYDQAVNAYQQVVHRTDSETAAKAQLQIGLCRMAQRRYAEAANALLVVPFTYDFPELNAAALCEAARCFVELKQQEQAARLLRRVLKDHAGSKWAEVAKQRLQALPGG
jgi:tetratricopeptide (TPR) repeat protein